MDFIRTESTDAATVPLTAASNGRPRVLLCDCLPFWGGGEHWIVQTGCALQDRGWKVTVGGRRQAELLHRARLAGLQAFAWGFDRDFHLATIRASSLWIGAYKPDVVMVTTARDIRTVGIAARRHGVPVVWRMGPKPHDTFVHRTTGKYVVKSVIAPSHFVADELTPFPWLTTKVNVIPNGIPIIDRPSPERVAEARLEIGVHDDRLLVLYVGRIMSGKGVDILIEAFARVHKQVPNSRLLMVGTGPHEAECRALAQELGIESAVELRGYVANPAVYYEACDLFVLASRYESFSYALLEAMIRSKPCVSTRAGAIPEVVGETAAILVPSEDPAALANAMIPLLQSAVRRELLGIQARSHVVKNYALDKTVDAVEALFRDVANPG